MPLRQGSLAALGVLALCACAAEPTYTVVNEPRARAPAPSSSAEEAPQRSREHMRSAIDAVMKKTALDGPDRGTVRSSFSFDVAALPRLAHPTASDGAYRTVERFEIDREGNPILMGGDLVAEVSAQNYRAYVPKPLPSESPLRNEPNLPLFRSSRGCLHGSSSGSEASVSVDLFRPSAWLKTELVLSRLTGKVDWSDCAAKLERSATVRARGVIPGVVYAFVTSGKKGDELVVIGPPAEWVATSTPDPAAQMDPHVGSFTRLEAPLERGRSSTILLNVSAASLGRFLRLRGEKPTFENASMSVGPVVSFSVEVLWPADSETPQGRVYALSLEPGGDEVLAALGLAADPRR